MQEVVRFWLDRGVDGFRVDAVHHLIKDGLFRDDPPRSRDYPLPLRGEAALLEQRYSGNRPEVVETLRAIREAAGDALLVGEVFLPTAEYPRYLENLDLVFAFELYFAPWDAAALRAVIEPAAELGRVAWVLSNHDAPRLVSRLGEENARAAALLLLTLPGAAFVYQGDEIGLGNGPSADPPADRAGRDSYRNPMQWDSGGGFTTGTPWLSLADPKERNVDGQRGDPGSLLELYRRLIEVRRGLGHGIRLLEADPGVLAFERGDHVIAVNTTGEPREAPPGRVVLATHAGDGLPSHAGKVISL